MCPVAALLLWLWSGMATLCLAGPARMPPAKDELRLYDSIYDVTSSPHGLLLHHALFHKQSRQPLSVTGAYGNVTLTFSPAEVDSLYEGDTAVVTFNLTSPVPSAGTGDLALTVRVDDPLVAEVTENQTIPLPCCTNTSAEEWAVFRGSFAVRGKRLGLALLDIWIHDAAKDAQDDPDAEVVHAGYRVIVLRERQLRDDIYRYGIIVFASVIYFGFGCQIDLKVIASILRKPVAPLIGIFCQFIVMPLLGFGVSRLIGLDDVFAFGLLAMSTSPGGGGSNSWAYLLHGDLNLSITMTFFSTTLSLVFMPLWMFALGRFFLSERASVPYVSLVRTLLTLVGCLFVGVLIRRFTVKTADLLIKVTKPITLLFIAFLLTYGTWVNWYMYVIMGSVPEVIPAAILLPFFGFFLGFIIAYFAARLGKQKSVTVAIETGYQNPSIPIIMLQGNFVQPEGDLGAVMPIATALFTQIPLVVYYCYIEVRDKLCGGKSDVGISEDDSKEDEEVKVEQVEKASAPGGGGSGGAGNPGFTADHGDMVAATYSTEL